MNTKKISIDDKEVENFYSKVVPRIKEDEILLVLAAARKKYHSSLSTSHEIVERVFIRSNKYQEFLNRIKRLVVSLQHVHDKNAMR